MKFHLQFLLSLISHDSSEIFWYADLVLKKLLLLLLLLLLLVSSMLKTVVLLNIFVETIVHILWCMER